jgi:hypothetical protein
LQIEDIEMNKRTIFNRAFDWPSYPKQVAYWEVEDDNMPVEKAKIILHEDFVKWASENIEEKYGFKLIDYSRYLIWFDSKKDAIKFLDNY